MGEKYSGLGWRHPCGKDKKEPPECEEKGERRLYFRHKMDD